MPDKDIMVKTAEEMEEEALNAPGVAEEVHDDVDDGEDHDA